MSQLTFLVPGTKHYLSQVLYFLVVRGNLSPPQCLTRHIIIENLRGTGIIKTLLGDGNPAKAAGCPRAVPAIILLPYDDFNMGGPEDEWTGGQKMVRVGIRGSQCCLRPLWLFL